MQSMDLLFMMHPYHGELVVLTGSDHDGWVKLGAELRRQAQDSREL